MNNIPSWLLSLIFLGSCVSSARNVPGTGVADTSQNRDVLRVLEDYRKAMEAGDAATLVSMAAPEYWEDGGTPTGTDDYGAKELRDVLLKRFPRAAQIRYSLMYMSMTYKKNRVEVQVRIDASYTVETARGPKRFDMKDQNELVLEHDGKRWLFVSGM